MNRLERDNRLKSKISLESRDKDRKKFVKFNNKRRKNKNNFYYLNKKIQNNNKG